MNKQSLYLFGGAVVNSTALIEHIAKVHGHPIDIRLGAQAKKSK